jgi:hypothetical protein
LLPEGWVCVVREEDYRTIVTTVHNREEFERVSQDGGCAREAARQEATLLCVRPAIDSAAAGSNEAYWAVESIGAGAGAVCRSSLKHYLFHLIQTHYVIPSIIELGRPRALMRGHLLRLLEIPAIGQVDRDPGCPAGNRSSSGPQRSLPVAGSPGRDCPGERHVCDLATSGLLSGKGGLSEECSLCSDREP